MFPAHLSTWYLLYYYYQYSIEVWSYSIQIVNLSTTFVKHHYRKHKEFVLLLTRPMSSQHFLLKLVAARYHCFFIIFFFLRIDNVIFSYTSDDQVLASTYLASMQIYIICLKEKDLVILLIFCPPVFWLMIWQLGTLPCRFPRRLCPTYW